MKIVFFDVKNFEKSYFEGNLIFENVEILYFREPLLNSEFLDRRVFDADIICVFTSSRLGENILSQFKNLKLICTRSVGFSHIDTEYCKNNGIKIATTPHYGDNTVAEFSFALLLDLVREISAAAHDVRYGDVRANYTGEELAEKTIGIFGTGAIGSKSVRIAKGFDMKIIASDPFPNPELVEKYGLEYVSVENLCENSDIIMLHAPLTKDNFHIFDAGKFNLMKPNAVIINTARGELIDTKALYNALLQKKIKGAALDVVECEEHFVTSRETFDDNENQDCLKKTLINHVLLNLKNVIVTPHIAYDTSEATRRILELTLQNLDEFLKNETMEHELNLHK